MSNDSKEIGRVGQRRYGGIFYEEFLSELRGRKGAEVFTEMSNNDETIGAILFAIEMLVRQASWSVEPGGSTAMWMSCWPTGMRCTSPSLNRSLSPSSRIWSMQAPLPLQRLKTATPSAARQALGCRRIATGTSNER